MPDRINNIDGKKRLHELCTLVNQISNMKLHSEKLIEYLDVEIEQTYAAAPKRVQGYKLDRAERRNPDQQQRERLLEKAIWKRWQYESVSNNNEPFCPNLCYYIQTFQMPLQGQRTDKSWGKIDLVGVTETGLPVVLELKRESSSETPLRMLVEGLAYAVALRRAWNEGFLRQEWMKVVTNRSNKFVAPETLLNVPVIGIAPNKYWDTKIGLRNTHTKGKVKKEAWKPFNELCVACSKRGFPISFVRFESSENDEDGLPIIENVELYDGIGSKM